MELPIAPVLADHGTHGAGAAILHLELHASVQQVEAGCDLG